MSLKQISVISLEDCDTDYLMLEQYFKQMEIAGNIKIKAHRYTTVADTLKAIDLIPDVDFIFADLCVPDSLGLSTVSRLAAHSKGTPIIVISGSDRESIDQQKLTDMGVIDFFDKNDVFKSSKAIEHNVCRLLMAWASREFLIVTGTVKP